MNDEREFPNLSRQKLSFSVIAGRNGRRPSPLLFFTAFFRQYHHCCNRYRISWIKTLEWNCNAKFSFGRVIMIRESKMKHQEHYYSSVRATDNPITLRRRCLHIWVECFDNEDNGLFLVATRSTGSLMSLRRQLDQCAVAAPTYKEDLECTSRSLYLPFRDQFASLSCG
jgi:hypothetical protein